jgi:hypothetical protein
VSDGDDELVRQLKTELAAIGIDPEDPAKGRGKRSWAFVIMPRRWVEALLGASGGRYAVTLELLWKARFDTATKPIVKLGTFDGVSPDQKVRAIRELERRGLVEILPGPPRTAPTVRLLRGPMAEKR